MTMHRFTLRKCLAVVSLVMAGSLAAQAEPVRFGVAAEPYPPFASKSADGTWQGFEIDLIHALCKRMQAECSVDEVAWDGIIPSLLAQRIDVIFASMSITDEREKQIAFSHPYYDTPVAYAASKDLDLSITAEGLKGKVIGVQVSTVSANYVKQYFDGIADIRYYDTQDSANADLLAGRIDLTMADGTAVKAFTDSTEAKNFGIVYKGEVPHDPAFGRGVGAGLRKDDTALKARLDKAIDELLASDEYTQLSNKYFGISVRPTR